MVSINKFLTTTVFATSLLFGTASWAEEFVTIGTGGVTGVYYPVGGAICRLMSSTAKDTGIRCAVESTGGGVFNINAIREGELQFGITQSDTQYEAMKGMGKFQETGAYEELRSVFSLYPEALTLVARADAGITKLDDLEGKRFNIGNPGSGQRATMDVVLAAKGWTTDTFKSVTELPSGEQSSALCDNNIDAMVFFAGHPNGSISEATTACDAVLVNIDGEEITKLITDNSYFREVTVKGGTYMGNDIDVTTLGASATLVTSSNVSEEAVYNLVKAVFENFDDFKSLHPALANVTKEDMASQGLTAPLHPGAEKYYKEAGLLK